MWVCLDLEPTPRALFGLDALTAKPKARVLIVEGPKTREVAAERFPGWAVVCAGGATGAAKFDWSPMRERRVTIWPDNDDPGLRYQENVARLSLTAGAKEVRCIIPPEGLPKGWDLADEAPEGWRLEEILDDAPEYRSDAFRYREAEDPPTHTSVVEFSDDFLALDFSSENADELRYCDQFGKWYCWDGTVWAEDIKRAVFTRARLVCRRHAPKARKLSAKLAREVSAARAVAAIVNLARADVRHVTIAADWDANPWSLNTPGGIVDLHTGEMHEHDRSELHSKITAVAPSKSPCHRWTSFLERITNNDEPLQKFLQRMAGYCLTGVTVEHALFFLYGTGANGKGTFLNTLTAVFGEYAKVSGMDTFTETKSERHPTDIAMLKGARLVSAQETEAGRHWAESKIKALTGGDPITARFMRQDFFTYMPQFKLVIAGNHKPQLHNIDEAMKRRLHMIPFTVCIPEVERDKQLFEKLKEEWPAILQWAIEGCIEWQKSCLDAPSSVMDTTNEYFLNEDTFGQWIAENIVRGNDFNFESSSDLYASWSSYAYRVGGEPGTQKAFVEAFNNRGYTPHRTNSGRGFKGISLERPNYTDDRRYGS